VIGRARAQKRGLDLSGASLQRLIYRAFPEAVDRPWGVQIDMPVSP
jgi:hypothetical protein